jgi:hypothetical protein
MSFRTWYETRISQGFVPYLKVDNVEFPFASIDLDGSFEVQSKMPTEPIIPDLQQAKSLADNAEDNFNGTYADYHALAHVLDLGTGKEA